MSARETIPVVDVPSMRGKTRVFANRVHAGCVLAEMLAELSYENAIVLAIPTGGVPVGMEIARRLHWPLDLIITSKVTPSWNPEVACGAVSFDGHATIGEEAESLMGLDPREVQDGVDRASRRVRRRAQALRGGLPALKLARQTAVLVDDGLATGYTMLAAISAARRAAASRIVVAVPTGHSEAVLRIGEEVDVFYCANIRHGVSFGVSEAYQNWTDLSEHDVATILEGFRRHAAG
jgi:putative phosphoribosyl transferase